MLCALSGGVDVRSLGGAEWRHDLSAEQKGMPRWFIDDRSDFSERLSSIRAPVLLLFGDRDPLSPPRVGSVTCAIALPSAKLHVIEGGDHMMAQEEPDRIAPLIAEFLGSVG